MANQPTAPPKLFVVGSFIHAQCWIVAQLPQRDETRHAQTYLHECAGKGLAVALGSHRLGASVDLLVAIGSDIAADQLLALLTQEGMHARHVHRLPGHSGHGCGLIDAEGHTHIAIYAGANTQLEASHLQQAAASLQRADVVYAQCEVPEAFATAALRQGQATGALTVLNPSPWHCLSDDTLAAADVLIVNRHEANDLFALLTPDLAPAPGGACPSLFTDWVTTLPAVNRAALWQRWPGQWLIVTLGAHGCVAYARAGQHLHLPGHTIELANAIGAGDAFSAGLCTALAQGQPMAAALRLGNACGALAASRFGIVSAALPTPADVQSLLDG